VASNQLPVLYLPTAWLFSAAGASSSLARGLEICYSLLGIAAIAGIGRLLRQPVTGLAAGLFLSLQQYYFVESRVFLGSVACVAVGALALWLGLHFQTTGRRRWLLAAGVALSLSAFIKPLFLFAGVLLVWAILAYRGKQIPARPAGRPLAWLTSFPWRQALFDCLCLGAAMGTVFILCLALVDGTAMISRLISCRVAPKLDGGRTSDYFVRILSEYAVSALPLLPLSLAGVATIIRRRDRSGAWLMAWLAMSIAFVVVSQAQTHHLVILDLPMTLLAAYPLVGLNDPGETRSSPWRRWYVGVGVVGLACWVAGMALTGPGLFSARPRGLYAPGDGGRWAAVSLLRQHTTPTDQIVSDDFAIPFEAQRAVIPQLVDVSADSVGCGLATEETFIRLADRQGAALVFWTGRFLDEFPVLPYWAQAAYAQSEHFDDEQTI
jgi:hypothetical protein